MDYTRANNSHGPYIDILDFILQRRENTYFNTSNTTRHSAGSLCNTDRYAVKGIPHMARYFYQQGTTVGLLRHDPGSLNVGTQFSDMMVNFWQLVEAGDGVFNRHTTVVSLAPVRSGSGRYIVQLHDKIIGRLSRIRVKNATHTLTGFCHTLLQ